MDTYRSHDDSGESDDGEIISRRRLVARGDAPELFELAEAAFDELALCVEMLIELVLDGARWIVGDDRHCALCGDGFAQMIRIVGRIGYDNFGGKILDQAPAWGASPWCSGRRESGRWPDLQSPFFAPAACW